MRLGIVAVAIFISNNCFAAVENPEGFKLKPIQLFTEAPRTSIRAFGYGFNKDAIYPWAGIILSTLILYNNDEQILNRTQANGRSLGLGNSDGTRTVFQVGNIPIFRFPSDGGSSMYFLGDGWMHTFIGVGFTATGYFGDYPRAWNTGLEIIHGMGVSTFFNQLLKRSFGRQSPNQRTEPRGKWRPFPSIPTYQAQTASYDAMPSGHIMTVTMVFTVISENYPEYRSVIIPVYAVWSSLLMWQMINNGVHWASDYPLGIGMGYVFGLAAARMGRPDEPGKEKIAFFPSFYEDAPMVNALYKF